MKKSQQGSLLLELILVIGLLGIFLPLLGGIMPEIYKSKLISSQRINSQLLLNEKIIGLKSLANSNWDSLSTGDYFLILNNNQWQLISLEDLGNYPDDHLIKINSVYRDEDGNFSSTGLLDPSSYQVEFLIYENLQKTRFISQEIYIFRHVTNTVLEQTSQIDFQQGIHQNTLANEFGQIQLEFTSDDSDSNIGFSYNASGSNQAKTLFSYQSNILVGTTDNGNNLDFEIIKISANNSVELISGLDLGADVVSIAIKDNFAFLATSRSDQELVIVDLTDLNNLSVVNRIDLTGNSAINKVVIKDDTLIVAGSKSGNNQPQVYLYNLAIDVQNPSLISQIAIADSVNDLILTDDLMYLATSANNAEIMTFSLNDLNNPQLISIYDLPGTANANSIVNYQNSLVLGTENVGGNSGQELYLIGLDLNSLPSSVITAFDLGSGVSDLEIYQNRLFVTTQSPAINNLYYYELNSNNLIPIFSNKVSTVLNSLLVTNSYLAMATNDVSGEVLFISLNNLEGTWQGSYTSENIELENQVSVHYLFLDYQSFPSTSLKVQISISSTIDQINFFGPDGTDQTYYTTSAPIPINKSLGKYLRYRVFFESTEIYLSPILEGIYINYTY